MHLLVFHSPLCPHCIDFLQELEEPSFQQELFDLSGPRLRRPIQLIDVLTHPEQRKTVPPFKTVPHVVLMDEQNQFISAFPNDKRSPTNLAQFVLENDTAESPQKKPIGKRSRRRRRSVVSKKKKKKTTTKSRRLHGGYKRNLTRFDWNA